MARIVAMPDGNFLSHTSRVLEVALQLRSLGHDVTFAASGEYTRLATDKAFEVEPVDTLDPEHTLACSRSGRVNWWDLPQLQQHVEADREIFRKLRPDLVLGDFRLSLATSAELEDIPYAVILNGSWTDYYTARVRAPEHLVVTRILGRRLTTWLLPSVKRHILQADARPFRKLRAQLGLEPRGNMWDQWRGDITLIADTPEYAPTEDLPDSFHYIGPIVWEPDVAVPEWLDELDPERPVLYVTMGSTGNPKFFHDVVELFAGSDYQCMLTLAGLTSLPSVPDNFFVCDYAPGSVLMQKADVAICQGGNGTIYQAMRAGVPLIGVPTMHDQEFNLDRVVELGVGLHLSELSFRPEHLQRAVETVLSTPSFRENARKQSAVLAGYDGPKRGAQVIDEYLRQRPPKMR
jgi:UDP:flavonoid glycosyltransferase YjiC (YdhE family)